MPNSRFSRRGFLKIAGSALAGVPCIARDVVRADASESTRARPNIIFVFSDDLSYRDLSAYGQKQFSTPHLDELALGGMRFTQTYSGSPECAPARASLMTGMHMGHCRIRANRSVRGQDHLTAQDVTVAEVLKQGGYRTGYIGKWGIGLPGTEGAPHKKGFDLAYGYYDQLRAHGFFPHYMMRNGQVERHPENYGFNMERVYKHTRDKTGEHDNRYDAAGRLIPDGVPDPEKASHSENLFQKEALSFIQQNRDKPFFLYYATQLPHGPCITPNLGAYKDKDWDQKHKEWAAMMTHLDDSVAKIVRLLRELRIEKNTVVFFAGDNGYSHWGYFGRKPYTDDPLFKNKGPWPKGKFTCTHEGGLRVPFFVHWPERIKAGESDHPCALYDFLATAADLAGVPAPPTDGISLLPTLLGRPNQQRKHEYFYWENGTHSPHAQSAREGQWWAYRPHPDQAIQLYRLDRDLACEHNVAGDFPAVVKRFEAIFKEAHANSEWYVNPGQSKAQIEAKRKRAQAMKGMQTPTRANTTFPTQ